MARRTTAQLYPACDPYGFEELLSEGERTVLARLREVLPPEPEDAGTGDVGRELATSEAAAAGAGG